MKNAKLNSFTGIKFYFDIPKFCMSWNGVQYVRYKKLDNWRKNEVAGLKLKSTADEQYQKLVSWRNIGKRKSSSGLIHLLFTSAPSDLVSVEAWLEVIVLWSTYICESIPFKQYDDKTCCAVIVFHSIHSWGIQKGKSVQYRKLWEPGCISWNPLTFIEYDSTHQEEHQIILPKIYC